MKKKLLILVMLLSSIGIQAQNCGKCTPNQLQSFIAFSPILVFVLVLIIVFFKMNKEGYKLGDALKENTTIEISEDNPAAIEPEKPASTGNPTTQPTVAAVPNADPFVPKTIQPKSSSRLIAFISGVVSLGIASGLCSFWMYTSFQGYEKIDFSDITNVLLALGIGVIPYAVNKISSGK